MKMLENPRKFKNSPNLFPLFVKITKFLEFSKKITIKNYSFFKLCLKWIAKVLRQWKQCNFQMWLSLPWLGYVAPIEKTAQNLKCKILLFLVHHCYNFIFVISVKIKANAHKTGPFNFFFNFLIFFLVFNFFNFSRQHTV